LNLFSSETVCISSDFYFLGAIICFVTCSNVKDTVCIDIESDFNLRGTSWSWCNTIKIELTKLVIVLAHWPFTFIYLNLNTRLVVCMSSENLCPLGRDLGIPWDKVGHDSACSLNSLRKWSDIKHEEVFELFTCGCILVTEDSSLNCCTISNSLIRVD